MRRSYSTGCTWLLRSVSDLVGVARRAREVAGSLGWGTADAAALSLAVLELSSNAVRHGGGGFPAWAIGGSLDGSRGLDAVRRLSSQLVLENVPGGGARARAALLANRSARQSRPITALAG